MCTRLQKKQAMHKSERFPEVFCGSGHTRGGGTEGDLPLATVPGVRRGQTPTMRPLVWVGTPPMGASRGTMWESLSPTACIPGAWPRVLLPLGPRRTSRSGAHLRRRERGGGYTRPWRKGWADSRERGRVAALLAPGRR